MPTFPHTALYLGPSHAVVISGPHIQVIDSKTGNTVCSTNDFELSQKEAIVKSGPIRCATVDKGFSILVAANEDKKLKVWQLDRLKLLSERELPKRPTAIRLTRDTQTILVSDKFGDIFSYPVHPDESTNSTPHPPIAGASRRGSLTSHENPSNGTLILGHTSLLTSFILTEDEKFVISADRDEHIRISWYPQGYVIERYCLGHKKFVSSFNVPRFTPTVLVSGGGEPELKLWDWLSGNHLGDIPILSVVEPYIKARAPSGHRGWYDDGEDGDEKPGRRRGKKKGKGKEKEKSQTPQTDGAIPSENAIPVPQSGDDVVMAENQKLVTGEITPESASQKAEAPVFVLHKLETVDLGEDGRFIVFSAVGATALFYTQFPSDPTSFTPSQVFALDLEKPVIEFVVAEDNKIWVLLDFEFQPSGVPTTETQSQPSSAVKLVSWTNGKLRLIDEKEHNPLLMTLNTKSLLPATEEDLKALDLYAQLASMPKRFEPEHDVIQREDLSELASTVGGESGKQLTQRELGRLKNKKALLAKIQDRQSKSQTPENGEKIGREGEHTAEERESKKLKTDDESSGGRMPL